ncbi:MAG: Ig-like domain-containing protein [Deltaproteobacteria bacterium]|nr:Ig-like domain-containing protein [Deltaproteobacteria bacterium]
MLIAVYGCGGSGGGGGDDQDTTAPTVSSTSPEDTATGVPVNSNVIATFSETMSSSSISETTFYVRTGGSNISGSISYGGTFATFDPMSTLQAFKGYTATVTTGVKDSNGNALASNHSWGFITGSSSSPTYSFATDVQPIFDSNCIVCHISLGQAAFLPLTNDVSYSNLVNKPSTYTSGGTLVIPGNSTDSILYKRISGASVGAQMPKGGQALSPTEQNTIKTWIDEGALNN